MSNEELQLEIEQLRREIELMKKAQDLNQNKMLFNAIKNFGIVSSIQLGNYGSDLQRTVTIDSTPDSFVIPEDPTKTAIIELEGNKYRILLYSLT